MTTDEKRKVLQGYCDSIDECENCKLFSKYGNMCIPDFMGEYFSDDMITDNFKIIFRTEPDNINSPSHYTYGKIECIDFIQDKQLNFCLGNAIKYIVRAGHKHSDSLTDKEKAIEDLKKAKKYLEFEIKERSKSNGN